MGEDGYWGCATTMMFQNYLWHYRPGYEATGIFEHQWCANLAQNPGLTSGWYCDSTLAGDPFMVAIQEFSGSGESDGILGTRTVRAIQAKVGTGVDGVFSAPSTCIRQIQSNFNVLGRPW